MTMDDTRREKADEYARNRRQKRKHAALKKAQERLEAGTQADDA